MKLDKELQEAKNWCSYTDNDSAWSATWKSARHSAIESAWFSKLTNKQKLTILMEVLNEIK